ncbi:MAG: hypothetical protein R3E10_06790 [Gemmatimonadota bacterium]
MHLRPRTHPAAHVLLRALLAAGTGLILASEPGAAQQALFADAFDAGLRGWTVYGVAAAHILDSGDPVHGNVLVLRPNGDAHVLIRGSEAWGPVRVEADVLFPEDRNNYLGLLYNVTERDGRFDFGNIYIKGNDSYLQVNPHRDYNVSRTLYPEGHVALTGADQVVIGRWQRVAFEVSGRTCRVYVGDLETPKLTFSDLELDAGALGFQPRSVGGEVWLDNVRVVPLTDRSARGEDQPAGRPHPPGLLTQWRVHGPLERTQDDVARDPAVLSTWRPFDTDGRGAVVTGRVVDYHGPRTVAYFRTQVEAERAGPAVLHLATVDDLALWVNGRFHWFVAGESRAWPDFTTEATHAGQQIPVELVEGVNEIVLRVHGGVYATGGFFAALEPAR